MRILGIEFGSWSLKAVEMESRWRQLDILELHEIRLPHQILDATSTYKQAIADVLARIPHHPEKIVTSLPPVQTALRFLAIPVKQRKKVEQMYRFELEDSIPLRLEDSLIEHHVSRTKDGSLVFAAVAPKKHVRAHVEWLKTVGIDPDWLAFEGMGALNLYLSNYAEKAEEITEENAGPVLFMDIGHLKTNIAVMNQGQLELFRSVGWGGAAVTQSISSSMSVSLDEAEKLKVEKLDLSLEGGQGESLELLEAASQAYVSFVSDLHHSLVSYQNTYKRGISKVLITGGTSQTRGIPKLLEKSLGVPVSRFHAFEGLKLKDELRGRGEPRFAEAIGRALVFARKSPLLFNFRKEELGKETSLLQVGTFLKDPNVVKLAAVFGLLFITLLIHVNVAGYLAEKESKAATEELRKVFSETFPSINQKLRNSLTNDSQDLKKFIDNKNQELSQRLKMIGKNRLPSLSLLRSISESFPANIRVDVNTVEFDDRSFKMDGVLYEGDLGSVTEALKKVTALNNVSVTQDGQRFTFKGEVIGR